MKAIIISFLLLVSGAVAHAQSSHVYYPNGERYEGDKHTVEHISNELEQEGRVYHFSPFVGMGDNTTTVGFLLFTDTPLWVFTGKPDLIDSAISLFDKQKFFDSQEFKIELNAFISKGVLTEDFILKTLGEPSEKRSYKTKEGDFDRWQYPDHGIDLILEHDVVTHYIDRVE